MPKVQPAYKSITVSNKPSSIPPQLANLTQETREKFVTDLAAISRGKTSSVNPTKRFSSLLNEAMPNYLLDKGKKLASRPLEFAPVVVTFLEDSNRIYTLSDNFGPNTYDPYMVNYRASKLPIKESVFYNDILPYSYLLSRSYLSKHKCYKLVLFTNYRCLYNAGIPAKDIPTIPYLYFPVSKNKNGTYITINNKTLYLEVTDAMRSGLPRVDSNLELKWDKLSKYKYAIPIEDILTHIAGVSTEDLVKSYNNGEYSTGLYEYFRAVKYSVPMFIWAQLMTHTRLSKESASDRIVDTNGYYWLPTDLDSKLLDFVDKRKDDLGKVITNLSDTIKVLNKGNKKTPTYIKSYIVSEFIGNLPQTTIQALLKRLGYKKEISSRAPYYFKHKQSIMTGWLTDPKAWFHLLIERGGYNNVKEFKNWVQPETAEVIKKFKKVLVIPEELKILK